MFGPVGISYHHDWHSISSQENYRKYGVSSHGYSCACCGMRVDKITDDTPRCTPKNVTLESGYLIERRGRLITTRNVEFIISDTIKNFKNTAKTLCERIK